MSDFKVVSVLNPTVVLTAGPAISAGGSSQVAGTIVFSNSNGVSFGLSNGTMTASAVGGGGGGVAISAGTNSTSTGTVVFSNSNGVSFGMDTNGVVTGTVATHYQSQGAYLTTAMASNRGTDFVQATAGFAGTNVSGTIASNGISVSVGNYLTTAMASNRGTDFVQATAAFAGTNASGTIASNGVSVSVNAQSAQPVAASASNGSFNFSTLKFVETNGITWATSTDGIRGSVNTAYIPLANSTNFAGVGESTTTTSGTDIKLTVDTNGVNIAVPPYITTYAAQSVQPVAASASNGSFNFSTLKFVEGFGVTWATQANGIQASVQTDYIPSANSSNFAGVGETVGTIAGTDLGLTVNTNGVSIAQPKFITTAMQSGASTQFVQANANFFGTNASGTIASNAISISVNAGGPGGGGVAISAGTNSTSTGTVVFSNSNGVSFGMDTNGVVTATVKTDYLTSQSVQTQASGNIAGIGLTTTTTAGTAVVGTNSTNGLSLGIPAYITTYAAQTNQTVASGNIAGTGFTSTTTAGTAIVGTNSTNGLSLGVPAFITTYVNDLTSGRAGTGFTSTTTAGTAITAALGTNGLSMAVPNFITTYVAQTTQTQASGAIAGTGFTSTTTAGTAVTAALGTNGLSMAVPQFITTYVNDLTSGRAGTGFTSTTTAGTAITAALGTNGLSMAVPQFITTAMQSNAATISNINVSAGTTSNNLSAFVLSNSNGLAFGLNGSTITGSYTQSTGAFNAGGNSSTFQTLGFSDNAYASWSNTNGSVALTELRGSFFAVSNTTQSSSGTQNLDAVSFAGAGGVSVGISNGSVVISSPVGAGGTTNQTGPNIGVSNLGSTAGTTGTVSTGNVVFVGTNGMQLSQSIGAGGTNATISIQQYPISAWANNFYQPNSATFNANRQSTTTVWPNMINNPISFDHVRFPMSMSLQSSSTSTTNNSSFTLAAVTYTFNYGIYATGSSNATSMTSVLTTSASMYHQIAVSMSNPASVWTVQNILVYPRNSAGSYATTTIADATSSGTLNIRTTAMTGFTGMRHFEIPFANSLQPNMYWMLLGASSTLSTNVNSNFSTALVAFSNWGMSQPNNTWGLVGENTASSIQAITGLGSFTTAGGGTVTGLGFSNISSAASHIVPYVYMEFDG